MANDKIFIENIKNISSLCIDFGFGNSNIIVVTGKNGLGKTTIIKCFSLLNDPSIFAKSSGESALSTSSKVHFEVDAIAPFTFLFNERLGSLDSRDILPGENTIISELPIPYGARFKHFSKIAENDTKINFNIA